MSSPEVRQRSPGRHSWMDRCELPPPVHPNFQWAFRHRSLHRRTARDDFSLCTWARVPNSLEAEGFMLRTIVLAMLAVSMFAAGSADAASREGSKLREGGRQAPAIVLVAG